MSRRSKLYMRKPKAGRVYSKRYPKEKPAAAPPQVVLQQRNCDGHLDGMISGADLYTVLTAMVPLYVAMLLGYGSVRWWNIFSAVQCSGINRFVSVFAIPLLSFYFISTNNPYKMDRSFLFADTASKLVILALLGGWAKFCHGSLDWLITLFSLSTLPNTLVMGIPLLNAMYGVDYQNIMVQLVVLQSIIWYTVLLFLLELRAARILLREQFPHTASSIVSFKIDADVVSLDGREPLQTHAEIAHDGKIRVVIRRSFSSSSHHFDPFQSPRRSSMNLDLFASPCRLSSPRQNHNHNINTSKPITPRPSNLTGAEIYSLPTLSSQNTPPHFGFGSFEAPPWSISRLSPSPISPRQSNFTNCEMYSLQSSRCPTPRESNFNNDSEQFIQSHAAADLPARSVSPCLPLPAFAISQPSLLGRGQPRNVNVSAVVQDTHAVAAVQSGYELASARNLSPDASQKDKESDNDKEPQMFMWSSSTSPPVSNPALPGNSAFGMGESSVPQHELEEQAKIRASNHHKQNTDTHAPNHNNVAGDFTFGSRTNFAHQDVDSPLSKQGPSLPSTPVPRALENAGKAPSFRNPNKMPSSTVMMKLILQMVGRKLLRNPNTYASLLGIIWALLAYRFDLQMPKIISESLRILWQAGLGMAMFSLGLFMALQPRLIACGTSLAIFAMAVRFITGPAVMAASSIAVGLRGVKLHAAIVQAALPQGIVPFVFSREYDLHPDILSTAVIFGMLVALPVTILYYVLLGI